MVLHLTSCRNEFEAEVIKGALADMGIESILQGQNMSQIYGGIGVMEVNILVDEKDYDKARAYIDTLENKEAEPVAEKEEKPSLSLWQIAKKNLPTAILITLVVSVCEYYRHKDLADIPTFCAVWFCTFMFLSTFFDYFKQKYFKS